MDFRKLLDTIDKINSWQILMEDDLSKDYWYIPSFTDHKTTQPLKHQSTRESEIEKTIQELTSIYNELKQVVGSTKLNETVLNEASLGGFGGIVTAILLEYDNIKALFEKDMSEDQRYTELSRIIGKLVANYGTFWVASTIGIALVGVVSTGTWMPIVAGIVTGLAASYKLEEDTNKMVDQIVNAFAPNHPHQEQPKLAPNGYKVIGDLQQAFIDLGYKDISINGLFDKFTIKALQQELNKQGANIPLTGVLDSDTTLAIKKYYLDDLKILETLHDFKLQLTLIENQLLSEVSVSPEKINMLKGLWNKFADKFIKKPPVAGETKIAKAVASKIPIKQRIQTIFKDNPKLAKALIGGAAIGGGITYKDELASTIKKASDNISQMGGEQPKTPMPPLSKNDQTTKPVEPTKPTSIISPEIKGLVATADQALARAAQYKDNRVRNAMERLDMFIDSIPGMRSVRKPAAWLN